MQEFGRDLAKELVEEGIRQLQEKGVEGFSSRAVAEICHVSCAAPFKHFKGRREFFLAMSKRLDECLLETMEAVEKEWGEDYKSAHLKMNEAYIRYLCENPFLINTTFWKTIDEGPAGIHKWKSFQLMVKQFVLYCTERQIPEEVYRSYYFNFQTLAYGAVFVIVNGLLMPGVDPIPDILDLQERIYRNLERVIGE